MPRRVRWTSLLLVAVAASVEAQPIFRDGFEESCFVDADGDRLADCAEVARALDYTRADTDGDGLEDGDEVLGTLGGLDLLAMGVDPRHKDLLVEMDWADDAFECDVPSQRPLPGTIEEVRLFFASPPIPHPAGVPGYHFIADYGQDAGLPGGVFTGGNLIAIPDGITSKLEAPFHAYKAEHFAANRYGYLRYQLHGHRWAYSSDSSGFGNIHGDNSVVTLHCVNSSDNVRNTIIHELGHNLGLDHGGDSPCNRKRNYNSLMNYNNQFPGLDSTCDGYGDDKDLLGFSDGSRAPLINGALDEALGVCPTSHPKHQVVDWNGNGVLEKNVSLPPGHVLALECAQ